MPAPLPIDAVRPQLEQAWARHRNFILRAPTGSGKSTRVPRMLLEWSGFPAGQRILILQPRRMAARLLARRVAAELGEPPGQTAGYQVRFEAVRSPATRLLFVTEGILFRQLAAGEGLDGVGAVLFDEFHERHLEGDVGLGLALQRQAAGWPGRIGVLSATLEVGVLVDYLPDAAVVEGGGRQYPVAVVHLGGTGREPVWEQAAAGLRRALQAGAEPDVLVFMPGKYEIQRTVEALGALRETRGWEILALHGELEPAEQERAIAGGAVPRIIVATNIAETSVTLPGIRTVLDSGLVRMADYDPRRGVNTLLTAKISRASAEQRAGRAGRVAPGRCFRLWTEADHAHRPAFTPPEIERLDLAETRLHLLALDQDAGFRWLQAPPAAAWDRAAELLDDLGARSGGRITPIGRAMARLPLHPRFSRMLLAARHYGCLAWAMAAVALAQGRSLILPLSDKRREEARAAWWAAAEGVSDLLRDVLVWQRVLAEGGGMAFCREWGIHGQAVWQAVQAYRQLEQLLGGVGDGERPTVAGFAKSVLAGYADHLARRIDRGTRRCELVHGRRGELVRDTVVGDAPLLVAAEVEEREFRGEATLFLGAATAVEESWLEEVFPGELQGRAVERLDRERRRVERVEQVAFRGLVLREKVAGEPEPAAAAQVLAREIHANGWPLKHWDAQAEAWIRRVNVLARHCPEWGINPIRAEDRLLLLEQICEGARSYKEVKDRPVMGVLHSWLPREILPLLDEWVPERFTLPGRGSVKLRYEEDGTVVLPARIQQLYDIPGSSLAICRGRCRLRLEILAPNGRPVQITDDLDGFWTRQYPHIRKELFGRYPRHEWR